jgi:serine/threonine-protein kinase RsbW
MPSDALEIRTLRAEEAPGLVACVRRCYGDSYLDPAQYDAPAIAAAIRQGRRHSLVAVTATGVVVGHMGLSLRRLGDNSADAGMTLVDPGHRGRGLSRELGLAVARKGRELGLVGAHDYPVTVHAATQRIGAGFGVDTGLLLDNMPADVTFQQMGVPDDARSASLTRYLPLAAAPERALHAPDPYRPLIETLCARAKLRRRFASGEGGHERTSDLALRDDARRRILRVEVVRVGADLPERIDALAHDPGRIACHVDLPLLDPGTPAACRALRERGFFWGGLLPEYRDGDVLRLQRLAAPPGPEGAPVLDSEEGRELRDFVLGDARAVGGRPPLIRRSDRG